MRFRLHVCRACAEVIAGPLMITIGGSARKVRRVWFWDGLHVWWGHRGFHAFWSKSKYQPRFSTDNDRDDDGSYGYAEDPLGGSWS
jgi:hypothetical protein